MPSEHHQPTLESLHEKYRRRKIVARKYLARGIIFLMLYLENVSKYYGKNETVALDRVSFQIAPKEFVSIVGHSGAGKTTLLKMLIAEDKPTEGAIFYESQDIHKISRAKLPSFRRKIGTIFQDFKL